MLAHVLLHVFIHVLAHHAVRHLAVAAPMLWMRHLNAHQLVRTRANFQGGDRLAERAGHAKAAHNNRRTRLELIAELGCGARPHPHRGAVFQQHAVHITLGRVQRGLHLAGDVHTRAFAHMTAHRLTADNHARGAGERHRRNHRHRTRLQATDRDLIARLDAEHQCRGQMRRHLHFGAIGQDQAIHLTAR